MDERSFLAELESRTGLDPTSAGHLAARTLEEIGRRMTAIDRALVVRRVPAHVAEALRELEAGAEFGLDELYERVADDEHARLGVGMEHARAVCEVLAEYLPRESLRAMTQALPADFAALFDPRPRPPSEAHAARASPSGHSLASGFPGAAEPLSEARR
jgi:uncharacterized protein (DUF2267 family)